MYDLASFGRKFITDLIHWQLIGSTIPLEFMRSFRLFLVEFRIS